MNSDKQPVEEQRRVSYHVRSDCEHQRERRAEGSQGADDGGTPRLMHLPASWDLGDCELEKRFVHVPFPEQLQICHTKSHLQI